MNLNLTASLLAIVANLIPLVFFIVAIIVAKKSSVAAWILFAVGVVLALRAIITIARLLFVSSDTLLRLLFAFILGFFVLFTVITLVLVIKRSKK